MSESLGFKVHLDQTYEQAIEAITAALKGEGFGVLTRIDVRATLREKLGEDFRSYAILGACNPPLAHRALSHDAQGLAFVDLEGHAIHGPDKCLLAPGIEIGAQILYG